MPLKVAPLDEAGNHGRHSIAATYETQNANAGPTILIQLH